MMMLGGWFSADAQDLGLANEVVALGDLMARATDIEVELSTKQAAALSLKPFGAHGISIMVNGTRAAYVY